jgi:hypothetical protein
MRVVLTIAALVLAGALDVMQRRRPGTRAVRTGITVALVVGLAILWSTNR